MAEAPAPPFSTQFSEQARDDLERQPELTAETNAVLLRAARGVRRRLEMGENLALDLHGRREHLTLRISLMPPDCVRIEGITPGDIVPDGAIQV